MSQLERDMISKPVQIDNRRDTQEKRTGLTIFPEMRIIKHFLHLTPEYIVKRLHFNSDYELDPVWPEVLLFPDKHQARACADWLSKAHKLINSEAKSSFGENTNIEELPIYRAEKYTDKAFYENVHRVPLSIRNLRSLEAITGLCFTLSLDEL